jgi:hypothetical protein
MILNDFHTVCAWEKFPNKEAWKYDLMLSKKFTNLITGEYMALMFKVGKCREVHVSLLLKLLPQPLPVHFFLPAPYFALSTISRTKFLRTFSSTYLYSKHHFRYFCIDCLINKINSLYFYFLSASPFL